MFTIQVKALRAKNYFLLSPAKVNADSIYVFVLLNKPGESVDYYVVPGHELSQAPEKFGRGYASYTKLPGILPKYLEHFRDKWAVFDATP